MQQEKRRYPLLITLMIAGLYLICGSSIAATSGLASIKMFDVMTRISVDGRLIASPRIITRENQQATIKLGNEENKSTLSVMMRIIELSNKQIQLYYDIQVKESGNMIQAKPTITVLPNQEARIQLVGQGGHSIQINVLANKNIR